MEHTSPPVTGRILNIQHFCVDDGPGIRTTVFLKGCPLRCVWCHNPESHVAGNEIMYRAERCQACGACVHACPVGAHTLANGLHAYDRDRCTRCTACTSACLYDALEAVGSEMTVDEVLSRILSDRIFYETSGGGVTLSGGEPTAQPHFAQALLAACRAEGIHTAMETCGFCAREVLESMILVTDLFLLDWKLSDDALHKQYTGVSNRPILQNLELLQESGAKVILRCPLIPDINVTESHFDGIAQLANRYSVITRIELEPYHPMGIGKATALGKAAAYTNDQFLDAAVSEQAKAYLAERVHIPVLVSGK